jgi:hypothetical protein
VLTVAAAPGILQLRLRTDGHALVPPEAPEVLLDDAIRQEFGLRDPIVVLLRSRHPEGIFHPETLRRIEDWTEQLALLPGVELSSVRSLATEVGDRFRPGTLERRRLLEPIPQTRDELERLRGDIEAIGLLAGTLISYDGKSAAILAGVAPGVDRTALVFAVHDLIAGADAEGHDVAVLGAPAAEALLGVHILEDLGLPVRRMRERAGAFSETAESGAASQLRDAAARIGLLPIAIAVMALVFLVSFRSLSATLLPLSEAGAALVFVFGLMGWTGVPVYLTIAVLPVILVSMGLVDEIHVFTAYRRRRTRHPDEATAESVRAALDETSLPVLGTGLTTCAGFLAFSLSALPPVRAFGIFAAAGVAFCMVWTLTVIPALLVLLREGRCADREGVVRANALPPRWALPFARLGRHPALILSVAVILLVLSPLAIRRVVVQDSWISGFASESGFRRATDYFNQHFAGAHRLLLVADTGHLELRGSLSAADLDHSEIRLPEGVAIDPAAVVGCSLAVVVPADSLAGAPLALRPAFWNSIVESAEIRGGRTVLRTPPVHGSALFLLQPAPTDTLDYVLRSQRVALPGVLRRLEALEEFVRARGRYAVGGVLGPPDHIGAAEYLTSDRAPGSRGIPSDPDRVRWLWHSIERVIGRERVREIVDSRLERGVITVFLKDANYADTARLIAEVREWEREHLARERIRLDFAGDVAVSQALIAAIVRSQVGSLLASLLGIAAVSAILFRSLRLGVMCMLPAGLAVAATFAGMGLTGMPLGVATSMFASIVLGIGVDFAIHLIERYRSEQARGAEHESAMVEALAATGQAILANALAVALGFGVLILSRVPANTQLGTIVVVSLTGCLAATLFVIPALLRVAASRRAVRRPGTTRAAG